MWSASGFFSVAALLLALMGFSGGSAAQTRGDTVARELQIELPMPQQPDAEIGSDSPARHFDPLTEDFWPVVQGGKSADITMAFDEFLAGAGDADSEQPMPARDAIDDEREELSGPVNFPISKSVRIKAQPLGGGLGARVTFTFLLPTGD